MESISLHAPVKSSERGDDDLAAASHGRLVRTDTGSGPVRPRDGVDPGLPLFDNATDELVHHVGVRPVMPAALFKGQVTLVLAVHKPLGKPSDRRRQQVGPIRRFRLLVCSPRRPDAPN